MRTHPSDYLKAIAKREIAWLESHATSELLQHPLDNRSRAQKSPAAHVKLYKKFLEIADHILPQGELSKPVLWHCDLRPANIFVKNDRITSIVNWQHAWVGPLFMQARHPQLVAYDGEMMLHLPDRCEQPDKERDHEEKKRLQDQVERSLILRHYERGIRKASPLMNEIMSLPHGQTRHDLVTFAENTWNGDIIPFRKSLALVTRKWKKIIGPMPCPVSFTQKQVNAHLREGEGWMKHADFWESKQGLITRDGWTTNELYESLKKQYEEYTTRKASRKGVNPLRNLVWRDGL
ncbi:uncharacterized protein J4E88_001955 [Alternaria novae-zelandiae]|uniref:uncharacterized protein n=1 Tax=Alternaria novae-zelandiae TaxID=430562 RepID=UPI0020C29AC1|nr:uncharacterized protein J4E88_001955 [Alternaria novae-zelandiae]KAI4693582.1 hypothetical protein J4E88_001955 [Alternaria novae-zelandiae]